MPRKAAEPNDPDKLVRQQAGTYRTDDGRFEVREANNGWFLVDSAQTNDFGQELILGPYSTLKSVREALPAARDAPASTPQPKRTPPKAPTPDPPPAPPPTWIDRLSKTDAAAARKLIRALEDEGIEDAESLVQRDRDGLFPAVAARLIERRLEALVDDAASADRERARQLVRDTARILTAGAPSGKRSHGLPGWTLVEIGPEPEPANRRISLDG